MPFVGGILSLTATLLKTSLSTPQFYNSTLFKDHVMMAISRKYDVSEARVLNRPSE